MNTAEIIRLKYRRQYIFAPAEITCPFEHNMLEINGYYLYSHIDLKTEYFKKGERTLLLLGDIIDYEFPDYSNLDILKTLASYTFNVLCEKLEKYCGRFVIIQFDKDGINCLTDTTASRKTFYSIKENKVWLASQAGLLASVLGLCKTKNSEKLSFYHSEKYQELKIYNIGNTTIFDEIFQVLPNHYIRIPDGEIFRYWPSKNLSIIDLDEAVTKAAQILKGNVEGIGSRYQLMIPITAGKDSRTIMAASKRLANKAYYYLNQEEYIIETHPDYYIPRKLLCSLGLKFNNECLNTDVEEDFKSVHFQNNEFAIKSFLPHIYNYYKKHSEKVNLPGVFVSSAKEFFGTFKRRLTPKSLAQSMGVEKYTFALEYYENWLAKTTHLKNISNFDLLTLFYWEERIANWGTSVMMDKDIAQEEIVPFNSRNLINIFESVDVKYNDKSDHIIFRRIIEELWPELLSVPVNPGITHSISLLFKKIGVIHQVRKLLFYLRGAKKNLSNKKIGSRQELTSYSKPRFAEF